MFSIPPGGAILRALEDRAEAVAEGLPPEICPCFKENGVRQGFAGHLI